MQTEETMAGGQGHDEFHFSPRTNRAAEIRWRMWSEEAFEEARREDKPILLSISAVWCHWCHVMDETSYSAQPVIDLLNTEYVPIRVDNDVRPDINQRYNMGGWPTTAFLTPQGDILTGATYLPPQQMFDSLRQVAHFYRTHGPEIAARVLEGRKQATSAIARQMGSLDHSLVDRVLGLVEGAYDPVHGGFGSAPKFPQTDALMLLLEQAALRDEPELEAMARTTLEKMAQGGTYDHVEGGFFRYSTTADWSVPHFEKMLEDHAGLVSALSAGGMSDVLRDATRYLDAVLRDPETGLYAGSQDADEHYYSLDTAGRREQQAPYVDRRVYSNWNCALAVAYLEADARLGLPQLRTEAAQALEELFRRRFSADSGLEHVDGIGGQLADQAWGLLAAVRAYGAGLGEAWLERARGLARVLDSHYLDAELGGYFDTARSDAPGRLSERLKPLAENSLAAMALVELETVTGDPGSAYRERAKSALESVAGLTRHHGLLAALYARALDRFFRPPVKVTTANQALIRAALTANPYCVIEPSDDARRAIVCVGTECLQPMTQPEQVQDAVKPQRAGVG